MKKLKAILLIGILLTVNTFFGQNETAKDWANLKKYATENLSVNKNSKNIVLMGDSITEFWKVTDNDFFEKNNLKEV